MLTSTERIERFLRGEAVDRPPVTPILMRFAAELIGETYTAFTRDYRVLVESYLRSREAYPFDMMMVISDPSREAADAGAQVEFPGDGGPVLASAPIVDRTDIDKLRWNAPVDEGRMGDRLKACALFKQEVGGDTPILGWVEGPLAEAVDLRGMDRLMLDLFDAPDYIADLMDRCLELGKRFALAQVASGAGWIGIGDAAVSLIAPATYRDMVLPREQELIAAIHAAGARVKLHICGNTTKHIPFMAQTGADVIDIDWMVAIPPALDHLPPGCVLCGNFDPVTVLLQGTPGEVRQVSLRCLAEGEGRLILAPGCEVPPGTPHENMLAFCSPEAFEAFASRTANN